MTEDIPSTVTGNYNPTSTITVSDESTSNKPWEATWDNFITTDDTISKHSQWETEKTSKTTLFSYDANVVPRELAYNPVSIFPILCPTPTDTTSTTI